MAPYNHSMKAITVTELKSHLSKYLRLASRGTRITVINRDKAIAELGPAHAESLSWRERMARDGRLRLGTQDWHTLEISKLDRHVDIQASLRAVRGDQSTSGETRPSLHDRASDLSGTTAGAKDTSTRALNGTAATKASGEFLPLD